MEAKNNKADSAANAIFFGTAAATEIYEDTTPHVKHSSLRALYGTLVNQVFRDAQANSKVVTILDLGAGEGSATLPFLKLGAHVTAVDLSRNQLDALQEKCRPFGDALEVRCESISDTLATEQRQYDVVVANGVLHHIEDYLGMIENAIGHIRPGGLFFSFQEPMRYDSMGTVSRAFGELAYTSWRIFQGDVWGGIARRIRRKRGIFLEDSVHDNVEYHITRNGVDQEAISNLLRKHNFAPTTTLYFSTQSSLFQKIGENLGARNTFAIVGKKSH
jgi:SAM-dependent methyltransferase